MTNKQADEMTDKQPKEMSNGPQTDRQTVIQTDTRQTYNDQQTGDKRKKEMANGPQTGRKKDRITIGYGTVHMNCEHRHTFREENVCVRRTHLLVIFLPRGTINGIFISKHASHHYSIMEHITRCSFLWNIGDLQFLDFIFPHISTITVLI